MKPNWHVIERFARLAGTRDWRVDSHAWSRQYRLCIIYEVEYLFGHKPDDLKLWQIVCRKVGLEEHFSSIEECQKVIPVHLSSLTYLVYLFTTGTLGGQFQYSRSTRC